MKEKFAKLIDVKSLVTLAMSAAFIYLSATGAIEAKDFLAIFGIVVAFYWGRKSAEGA